MVNEHPPVLLNECVGIRIKIYSVIEINDDANSLSGSPSN